MDRIKHTFYINLESRPDRRQHVEQQLSLVGIKNAERFNAIRLPNGAIGCSMSHLKCLETALANDWEHILIVEDDILFLQPEYFVTQFNKFLELHQTNFDVLLIGGGIIPDSDAEELNKLGVARLFAPGTEMIEIVTYIKEKKRL